VNLRFIGQVQLKKKNGTKLTVQKKDEREHFNQKEQKMTKELDVSHTSLQTIVKNDLKRKSWLDSSLLGTLVMMT
jgi:hypothetical protein